jgi:hypothetical protein
MMNEQQIQARMKQLLAEELEQKERWYYVSFAAEEGFRGAAIVRAHGVTTAIMRTHALDINPGGQVLALPISAEMCVDGLTDRLLTREEITAAWPDTKSLKDHEAAGGF